MSLKSELMAIGVPSSPASDLGLDPITAFTAAGTTQGTATTLTANNANVTTSSIGAGVIVASARQLYNIYNAGPNVLTIYPIVGGTFAGLALNGGFQVAPLNSAQVIGGGLNGGAWSFS